MDREELLLIFSSSVVGVVWGSNVLIIPLYFKSLGLSPLIIGEVLSLSILTGTLLSLLLSALGDAYGRKKFIFVSKSIGTLSYFLLLFTPFSYLFVNQGYGLVAALMAEKSRDLDKAFSYRASLNIFFSVLGSLLPLFLDFKEIITLNGFILLLSLLLLIPVKEKYKGTGKMSFKVSSFKLLGKLSTEALIGLGAGILLPMLSLWFNLRFGVSASEMSPIYALSELTLALGVLGAPVLSKLMGRVRAIFVTHMLAIGVLVLIPFSTSFLEAGILYVVRNTLMNSTSPLMSSLVLSLVKEEERSRVNSFLQLIDAIPRSLGPTVTGYLFTVGGLDIPFFITATLYFVATLLFYMFFKQTEISPS